MGGEGCCQLLLSGLLLSIELTTCLSRMDTAQFNIQYPGCKLEKTLTPSLHTS